MHVYKPFSKKKIVKKENRDISYATNGYPIFKCAASPSASQEAIGVDGVATCANQDSIYTEAGCFVDWDTRFPDLHSPGTIAYPWIARAALFLPRRSEI